MAARWIVTERMLLGILLLYWVVGVTMCLRVMVMHHRMLRKKRHTLARLTKQLLQLSVFERLGMKDEDRGEQMARTYKLMEDIICLENTLFSFPAFFRVVWKTVMCGPYLVVVEGTIAMLQETWDLHFKK